MIRKAQIDDMDDILCIVKDVILEMENNDNDQWTDAYPVYDDFLLDISAEELFVDVDDMGTIMSFVCLNTTEPSEYRTVSWASVQKALIIHRLAVNPQFREKGLAKKLLAFAEETALEQNLKFIRSDTCVKNPAMNFLFEKLQYKIAGNIRFSDTVNDFNCYEKSIS